MKHITLLFTAVLLLTLISCAPGGKDQSAEQGPIPSSSMKVIIVKHPVADYTTWKAGYMAHDSMRQANGISTLSLGRGTDDANMVIVINQIKDFAKAKEFAALPELKTAMEKAGVTGPPSFVYLEVVRDDTSSIPQKDRVMLNHRVKDFDAWLKVYDGEGRAARAEYGIADRALARDSDDPNMVYIVFAIMDKAKLQARLESEELKKLMTEGGVEGPPSSFFYTLDN